jgi:hypothetical protein
MTNLGLVAASTMPLRPQTPAFPLLASACRAEARRAKAGTIIALEDYFLRNQGGKGFMARKYSKQASADVERAMKKRKAGTLKSGRSAKKVTSRKQAIAIGLSEARAEGKKVPKKNTAKKAAKKKTKAKKSKR